MLEEEVQQQTSKVHETEKRMQVTKDDNVALVQKLR
jgi:hypothetical protein